MNYKEQIEKMAKLTFEEQMEYKDLSEKVRKKTMEENKEYIKGAGKNTVLSAAGLLGATQGAKGVTYAHNNGFLDGRKKLYHNTDKVNVKSILEEGLKGSKTNENSYTRDIAERSGFTDFAPFKDKVYLGSNRGASNQASNGRFIHSKLKGKAIFVNPSTKDILENRYKNTKTLKASIPFNEYSKLKGVPNPELRGAKSMNEYLEKVKHLPNSNTEKKVFYKKMGKNTVTIDGDFASKFIKGGKGYQKLTTKEVFKHIKNNPGMVAKGAALTGLGTAGAIGGTYLAGKSIINNAKANYKLTKERRNNEDNKRLNDLARKSIGWSIKK